MQRNVTPEEMIAIAQLAAENPDLRQVVVELGRLRALRAATAPLRPASVRELLKAVDAGILSKEEARPFMGLEARRGTLERVADWWRRLLPVVVAALARRRALSRSGA